MRKLREAIRNDTEMYSEYKTKETERYHRRKTEGKIKLIADIESERTKRSYVKIGGKELRNTEDRKNYPNTLTFTWKKTHLQIGPVQ